MSFIPNLQKLRENPETARAGFPWTGEETRNLYEKIDATTYPLNFEWYEQVAHEHRRTPGAIHAHMLYLAVHLLETEPDIDAVASRMKLTKEEIQKERDKRLAPKKAQKALRNKLLIHCTHLEKDLEVAKKEIANMREIIEKLK